MTDARKKAKIELLKQGLTLKEFAPRAGCSLATVDNHLAGRASSPKAKQAITNALGVQIWDDTPVTTTRGLSFAAGTVFVFPTVDWAKEFADEIKDAGERRDREVRLSRDLGARFEIATDPDEAGPPAAAELPAGAGDVLEIWSGGDVPPGSAFPPGEFIEAASDAVHGKSRGHTTDTKKASKAVTASGKPDHSKPESAEARS